MVRMPRRMVQVVERSPPLMLLLLSRYYATATALPNQLGRTPIMGWSSWNAYGATPALNESTILAVMDALIDRSHQGVSLLDRGYRYVNLDDGVVLPERNSDGTLAVDPERFPSGMASLAEQAHRRGLLLGVYTARGPRTCCGRAGSYGHEELDADTYASWKVDYLKNDGCTGGRQLPGGVDNASATLYAKMRDAVARATARTGRPIFLNIKQDIVPGGFGAACALANSFRVADDIKPCQGETGLITDIASQALRYAGPGCFLDLDSLEVGVNYGCPNDEDSGSSSELGLAQWKAQLALWSVISAQLVLGNDLPRMAPPTRELLLSPGYVAISQDPLGVPGRLLRIGDRNSAELWGKPLADRSFAAVMWYRNQTQAVRRRESKRLHSGAIELDFRDLGFQGLAEVVDVWTNNSFGVFRDGYVWSVGGTGLNSSQYLGSARFVYVRPRWEGGGAVGVGCSAWGGANCSSAPQPAPNGLFW